MRIALCNIVKDDSEFSSWVKMIESAKNFVDEIHVVVNNKPHKQIEKYAKKNNINLEYLEWKKDYSEQRNYNFSMVSKDVDYILWLDSDDILIGGEYLREVAGISQKSGYHALFIEYWYGCLFKGEPTVDNLVDVELYHPRERLLKPGAITWKKRIHETPIPANGLDYKYSRIKHLPQEPDKKFPIAVMHTGADRFISKESLENRMARNKEMLELELEDERKENKPDPRTMLYLLKIYAEYDDTETLKKGLELGKEYLTLSGWDLERSECLTLMSQIAGKVGNDKVASEYLHLAIKEYPYSPMPYLMLSEAYYNLGDYSKCEFYLEEALKIDFSKGQEIKNILKMKLLTVQLKLRLEFYVKKNIDKSVKLAEELFKLEPTKETKETLDYISGLKETNDACRNVDQLVSYYSKQREKKAVFSLLESLPQSIKKYPFVSKLINRHGKPKKWAEKEICYYASFGQRHVEQWSPKNLKQGLGGSETAVIKLAKEWSNLGYKVTVYCDCGSDEGIYDGVTYLPFYKFNPRDHFNIFIQWRNNSLAGKILTKKFLVDLHDVWSGEAYKDNIHSIYKVMTKSKAHRDLAKDIPDIKFSIVGNGI